MTVNASTVALLFLLIGMALWRVGALSAWLAWGMALLWLIDAITTKDKDKR